MRSLFVLLPLLAQTQLTWSSEMDDPTTVVRSKRLAVHPFFWSTRLWPNAEVPYDIASHYTPTERAVILSAMKTFHVETCVRFRPRTATDKFYVQVNKYYDLERCFSYIGRQTAGIFRTSSDKYETRMKLAPSCLQYNGRGTVMHELMHILGFYHEHQRDDRDPRIGSGSSHYNFRVRPRRTSYYMGRYDETSIMHYNFPGMSQRLRDYFSPSDVLRINALYHCPMKKKTLKPSKLDWNSEDLKSNSILRRRRI